MRILQEFFEGLVSLSKGGCRTWFETQLGPLKRHVHLLGVLSPAKLDEAYRRAWVVVVPSRWDTFPQVVLESMVRGKAIVSSPNGGIPEMLEGTGAVIADPASPDFAEAIATFIRDGDLRRNAGTSALKKAETAYSPMKIAKDYIGLVETFC